jgi:SAM-dependent methyltransferase
VTDGASPRCPYCKASSQLSLRYDGRMTVCADCGAWFVWPPPTAALMREHYERNRAGMPADLRAWRSGTTQNGWYEYLARRIARAAGNRTVRSVADVGAGGLELTMSLAAVFSEARVEAWDLFSDRTDQDLPMSSGGRVSLHRIDLNELENARPPDRKFDVVACVAVIEHVLDPVALLRQLRSMTAPGGSAWVVGPLVTSIAHRVMRNAWPYYCPDEHLTLPSLRSIERAVADLGGGEHELRRVNVRYSLQYLLRFLRVPIPIPRAVDFLLPIPAGAFELVWHNG